MKLKDIAPLLAIAGIGVLAFLLLSKPGVAITIPPTQPSKEKQVKAQIVRAWVE